MSEKEIEVRLNELHGHIMEFPISTTRIRMTIKEILEILVALGDDAEASCRMVNDYILLKILSNSILQKKLIEIPSALRTVIEDMGACLHDTHSSPEIARMFESTPLQLLARIRKLDESV